MPGKEHTCKYHGEHGEAIKDEQKTSIVFEEYSHDVEREIFLVVYLMCVIQSVNFREIGGVAEDIAVFHVIASGGLIDGFCKNGYLRRLLCDHDGRRSVQTDAEDVEDDDEDTEDDDEESAGAFLETILQTKLRCYFSRLQRSTGISTPVPHHAFVNQSSITRRWKTFAQKVLDITYIAATLHAQFQMSATTDATMQAMRQIISKAHGHEKPHYLLDHRSSESDGEYESEDGVSGSVDSPTCATECSKPVTQCYGSYQGVNNRFIPRQDRQPTATAGHKITTSDLAAALKTVDTTGSNSQRETSDNESLAATLLVQMPDDEDHKLTDKKKKFEDDDQKEDVSVVHDLAPRPFVPRQGVTPVYTVPRFPDNHNPLLNPALQKRLEEMAPQEYLEYVLKELTLEERESLMVDERQRRKTFQVNWPYDSPNLCGIKMAQAGFYYVNDRDRVQCVFCRGSLHRWDPNDIPMTEHQRSFNFCRYVKGLECGNREYRSDNLAPNEIVNITLFKQPELKRNRDGTVSADSGALGISTNRAAMVEYAPSATRMRTFGRWPADCPIDAKSLCDAGFYYTGFDDQVRCFYCAGGIREWSATDEPWVEHARWFPDCAHLIQHKGEAFVDKVHMETPANKKSARSTEKEKKREVEQKEQQSQLEAMVEFAGKLGHPRDRISKAIQDHSKPFVNVKDLIDMLYDLEEQERELLKQRAYAVTHTVLVKHVPTFGAGTQATSRDVPDSEVADSGVGMSILSHELQFDAVPRMVPPQDELRRAQTEAMEVNTSPDAPEAKCKVCFKKTGQLIDANHVALPCGHLIMCESCNKDEEVKSRDASYKPKCLYKKCGAPLAGTFRIFFA